MPLSLEKVHLREGLVGHAPTSSTENQAITYGALDDKQLLNVALISQSASHRRPRTPLISGRPPDTEQAHLRLQTAKARQRLEERIENAIETVAVLLETDEAYLPIFLRLEAEYTKARARGAVLARARGFLRSRH